MPNRASINGIMCIIALISSINITIIDRMYVTVIGIAQKNLLVMQLESLCYVFITTGVGKLILATC